jgi:hypothetical protein
MPQDKINLLCPSAQIKAFSTLFQEGVFMDIPGNISLGDLLVRQWGLEPEFMQERIQTIFLDGHPVDKPDEIIPESGSVLALSAAMPGLVGATMRKSGTLASLRDSITYRVQDTAKQPTEKRICLRLFNFLLKELAPHFLKLGVLVKTKSFQGLIQQQPQSFWSNCQLVAKNKQLNLTELKLDEILPAEQFFLLKINAETHS